jgi:hypothetical protein
MATCPGYPALPGVAQARRYVAGSSQLRIPYLLMVDDAEGIYALTLGDLDDPYFRTNTQKDLPSGSVKASLRSTDSCTKHTAAYTPQWKGLSLIEVPRN